MDKIIQFFHKISFDICGILLILIPLTTFCQCLYNIHGDYFKDCIELLWYFVDCHFNNIHYFQDMKGRYVFTYSFSYIHNGL